MLNRKNSYPPNIQAETKLILFDGVCKLCNAWSRFIIFYDKSEAFTLASVQSPEGQKILSYYNMPTSSFDTMMYIEGNKVYTQSDAFLNVIRQMSMPWKLLNVFRFLPKVLRDWLYDRIALNRYTIFGKYDVCMLPTPDHDKRFLKDRG